MQTGVIARLVRDKGFGFIKVEGMEKDLFFHTNELKNATFEQLNEGDTVSFEVGDSPKGPNAVNVSKVEAGAPQA
jgi:CspA family cold shock protein